jgi:hypothetical protein
MISPGYFNEPFSVSAKITLSDSTELSIPSSKLAPSGFYWSQSAGSSTVPLGYVVGRSFHLRLINDNDEFSSYDFWGASVELTVQYTNYPASVVFKNLVITEPPETLGLVLEMTALDNAWRLDKPWTSALVFPATLNQIFLEICSNCGIDYISLDPSSRFSLSIPTKPDAGYSCREMLSFIAQIAGGNFRINVNGKLQFVSISSNAATLFYSTDWINFSKALKSVRVTGISVEDENGDAVTAGTADYVLEIESSPLTKGQEQTIVNNLLTYLSGKSFRKFDGATYSFLGPEIFDYVAIPVENTNTPALITDVTWNFNGASEFACNIETPKAVGSSYDPSIKALQAARSLIATERTAREQAVINLTQAIAAHSGMFETTEQAQGGGTIYYLHDKPTLAASTNVIKVTSEAIGLSTDGGATYPAGVMINGDVVARLLAAEGVSADWINTGALTVTDATNNRILFQADVGTGYVYIDGMRVDDGVVSLGAPDSTKQVVISDNGIELQDSGIVTAKFGNHGALFPGKTEIDTFGYLQLGNYQICPRADGGVRIIFLAEY